ncbi:hypothetical protein, partial [Saezia sanguinis]|uniref:hypothetical protein n=1 Tax=Saezia sanguinis TaxID=1965230 RepID=UPI0019500886
QDILSGAVDDVSAQADHVLGVVNQAAAPMVETAQGLLGQVATAAGVGAPAGAAAPAAGVPAAAAPALPSDPVGALLNG